jgi:hypothetical protein
MRTDKVTCLAVRPVASFPIGRVPGVKNAAHLETKFRCLPTFPVCTIYFSNTLIAKWQSNPLIPKCQPKPLIVRCRSEPPPDQFETPVGYQRLTTPLDYLRLMKIIIQESAYSCILLSLKCVHSIQIKSARLL